MSFASQRAKTRLSPGNLVIRVLKVFFGIGPGFRRYVVRLNLIELTPQLFDQDLRIDPILKPLHRETA
jgi:hypothetical protein